MSATHPAPEFEQFIPCTILQIIQYSSPNIEDAIKKKATSEKFLAKLISQFKVPTQGGRLARHLPKLTHPFSRNSLKTPVSESV